MKPIKVVVHGAAGRMGQEIVKTVCQDPDLQLVGAVDLQVSDNSLTLPGGKGTVPFASDLARVIAGSRPDVVVDFTIAKATMPAVRTVTKQNVNMVIGTTGLTADDIKEIEQLAKTNKVGIVVAPNFALGAVLMMHLAKTAAKYFDYAEIIELHHEKKVDAPSGTALATAKAMAASRGKPFLQPPVKGERFASRGQEAEGITIHSVRLPGFMAHQEVLLGGLGQILSIRHDMISREGFMPGVMLAIKEVVNRQGLTYGLDNLLGL